MRSVSEELWRRCGISTTAALLLKRALASWSGVATVRFQADQRTDASGFFFIDLRGLDIVQRILKETFALLWRERTLHLSRHAHHHALCRHFCALRHNSTGRDHGTTPDLRAIQ